MKLPAFIQATIFLSIITVLSCSKSDDAPNPQPNPDPIQRVDTLTTGWTKLSYGKDTYFADIFFQNGSIGYAVGSRTYKTVNGGVSWDSIGANTTMNISVTPNGKIFYTDQYFSFWKSLDNGTNFSAINFNPRQRVYDVFFSDSDSGYVSTVKGELITTTNGGGTWGEKIQSLAYSVLSESSSSLFFLNAANGWVTNGLAVSKTNGSINSWTKCNVGPEVSIHSRITSLYAPSANIVYAGCGNGTILKSANAGLDFSLLKKLPGTSTYSDLHFIDDLNGYVLYDKCIYKTSDGGSNWQTVATLGEGNLVELHFTDANHGWACGSNGTILRYSR